MSVYEDANFRGRNATFIEDMPDLGQTGSIAGSPASGWRLARFGRSARTAITRADARSFPARRPTFNSTTGTTAIRLARRVRRRDNGRGGRGNVGPEPGTLELFAGTRYSGQRAVVERAESNLRRVNFNDRASSLRVATGEAWEVCVNANYDDCRLVDEDMSELASIGLNRQISSVRPRPDLARGRGGRGGQARAQMVLYDQANYRGQSRILTANTPVIELTSNSAGSVRILSGRWSLDRTAVRRRCVTLTQHVPDLVSLRLPGRVSSARIR